MENVTVDDFEHTIINGELVMFGYLSVILEYLKTLPGAAIVIRYIRYSYQDDPIRSVIELSLLLFAVWYFFNKKTSPDSKEAVPLSEKEIDELCKSWKPAPLTDPLKPEELFKLKKIPIVNGAIGKYVDVNKKGFPNHFEFNQEHCESKQFDVKGISTEEVTQALNLSSHDFFDLSKNERIASTASEVIRNHGVGACGPPGFFGNQDIHIKLEEKLADWFQTEAGIIYGQDFCTFESIIPTFLRRGDVAIVDARCNIAIQRGLLLSRCQVIYYEHNNYDHVVDILEELQDELKDIKPLNRRFIITEGLFANVGDFPDLKKLVEIKEHYKFRLFVDESFSVGVLGKHGRGLTDYYNIPASRVDMIVGSLANSLTASGGFCVGVKPMIFNQRIASASYCFSASLPPYSAKVAHEVINILEEESAKKNNIITKLTSNSRYLHGKLTKSRKLSKYFSIISVAESPIVILELTPEIKKKLGFKNHYTNELSKFAQNFERGLSLYEESKNPKKTNDDKKEVKKVVDLNERVDFYSEKAVEKRRNLEIEKKNKLLRKTQAEIYNLEDFLLSKFSNELLINDKLLVANNQRLLKVEIVRVNPQLKLFLNSALNNSELDNIVFKLNARAEEFFANVNSLKDVEKLNLVEAL